MVKRLVVCFALLLVLSSFASAVVFEYQPGIRVQASPNQNVIIRFKDVDTGDYFKTISFETDSGGSASGNLETNRGEVNVVALIVENMSNFIKTENIIQTREAGPFDTSEVLVLNVRDNLFNDIQVEEPTVEEALENLAIEEILEEEIVEPEVIAEEVEETKSTGALTGSVVSAIKDGVTSSWFVYSIIGIIVLGGMAVFFMKVGSMRGRRSEDSLKIIKLSDAEKRLDRAAAEVKQAKEELESIKSQRKEVVDAESAFKAAKERLERLKGEKEDIKDKIDEVKEDIKEDTKG